MASTTPFATPWDAFEARVPADALNRYKRELFCNPSREVKPIFSGGRDV